MRYPPYHVRAENFFNSGALAMSIGEKGICVRILEKEFRVACAKDQESALRDAALYLDKQMRVIRNTGRIIGLERIAVMAALNITNELLKLKNNPSATGEIFFERIKVLQEKIDSALATAPIQKSTEETAECLLVEEYIQDEEKSEKEKEEV